MASAAPTSHPSIACGPPIVASKRGMVMYGPMPTISVMAMAVACTRPSSRFRPELLVGETIVVGTVREPPRLQTRAMGWEDASRSAPTTRPAALHAMVRGRDSRTAPTWQGARLFVKFVAAVLLSRADGVGR